MYLISSSGDFTGMNLKLEMTSSNWTEESQTS